MDTSNWCQTLPANVRVIDSYEIDISWDENGEYNGCFQRCSLRLHFLNLKFSLAAWRIVVRQSDRSCLQGTTLVISALWWLPFMQLYTQVNSCAFKYPICKRPCIQRRDGPSLSTTPTQIKLCRDSTWSVNPGFIMYFKYVNGFWCASYKQKFYITGNADTGVDGAKL